MLGKPGKGGEQTLSLHIRKMCERATLERKQQFPTGGTPRGQTCPSQWVA